MKLDDFVRTEFLLTPWPTLIDGRPAGSSATGESSRCRSRCPLTKDCSKELIEGEHTCLHGMSYFVNYADGERVTAYGLRGSSNSTKLSSHNKDWYRGCRVDSDKVALWFSSATKFLQAYRNSLADAQSGLLDVLHDPIRLAKQITTISNRMAKECAPTDTPLSRAIDTAPPDIKTLVKASELLSDSFTLLTIYMNPEAATYGRQVSTNLHGLATKLAAVLRTSDEGFTSSWQDIRVGGSCLKNVAIYESFKIIPFSLITNAIKYSPAGKQILVTVDDMSTGGVEMSVSSVGPLIEKEELARIFEKNFRGKWASGYEGRGVGLYLADVVARAHKTTIRVTSTAILQRIGEVPLANNRFSVRVMS